jgi:hypothetical protein
MGLESSILPLQGEQAKYHAIAAATGIKCGRVCDRVLLPLDWLPLDWEWKQATHLEKVDRNNWYIRLAGDEQGFCCPKLHHCTFEWGLAEHYEPMERSDEITAWLCGSKGRGASQCWYVMAIENMKQKKLHILAYGPRDERQMRKLEDRLDETKCSWEDSVLTTQTISTALGDDQTRYSKSHTRSESCSMM